MAKKNPDDTSETGWDRKVRRARGAEKARLQRRARRAVDAYIRRETAAGRGSSYMAKKKAGKLGPLARAANKMFAGDAKFTSEKSARRAIQGAVNDSGVAGKFGGVRFKVTGGGANARAMAGRRIASRTGATSIGRNPRGFRVAAKGEEARARREGFGEAQGSADV